MKIIISGVFLIIATIVPFFITHASAEILFEEVTEEVGLSYNGRTYGASWGDFNGDGKPDLWVGSHLSDSHKIFINNGSFYDISSEINLNSFTGLNRGVSGADPHTGSWADFDNDGDQDLMVIGGGANLKKIKKSPNVLLVNNGGFFEDKADELGIKFEDGRGRMPLWFDFNSDGLLDVFLANEFRTIAPSSLFENKGGGFEQVKSSGIKIKRAEVVNTSHLFFNATQYFVSLVPNSNGVYDLTNLPAKNIVTKLNLKINNVNDLAIEDFNGDLLPDMFFTSMNQLIEDKLFVNTGSEFVNQKTTDDFFDKKSCLSIGTGDFDNDEDVDIYLVCTGKENNMMNILYENLGNGTFSAVPAAGGAKGSPNGSAETVAVADYDGDGFLDLFVTNGRIIDDYGPSHLFKNIGNENHWIKLDLIGTTSNKDGIGTRVLLTAGEKSQIREQTGGMHYRAQNYKNIHFGLGQNKIVDNISIYWPSGIVQEIKNVEVDQTLKIEEKLNFLTLNYFIIIVIIILVIMTLMIIKRRLSLLSREME